MFKNIGITVLLIACIIQGILLVSITKKLKKVEKAHAEVVDQLVIANATIEVRAIQ